MLPLNHISYSSRGRSIHRVKATKECVRRLEASSVFSIVEKVHLLCLLLGFQHITDIGIEASDLAAHRQELQEMHIPFTEETWDDTTWLLAGASETLLDYVHQKHETLSEAEAGMLYGYPATAVLAFTGVFRRGCIDRPLQQLFSRRSVFSRCLYG